MINIYYYTQNIITDSEVSSIHQDDNRNIYKSTYPSNGNRSEEYLEEAVSHKTGKYIIKFLDDILKPSVKRYDIGKCLLEIGSLDKERFLKIEKAPFFSNFLEDDCDSLNLICDMIEIVIKDINLVNTKLFLESIFKTENPYVFYQIFYYWLFMFGKWKILDRVYLENRFYIEYFHVNSIYEIVLDMIVNESFNYQNNIYDIIRILDTFDLVNNLNFLSEKREENYLDKIRKFLKDENDIDYHLNTDDIVFFGIKRNRENDLLILLEYLYSKNLIISDNFFSRLINSNEIDFNVKNFLIQKEIGI